MPREMASRRPCRRASYSASLLDTSKRIWKVYLSYSPFGEMKSMPSPPPPNVSRRSTCSSDPRWMLEQVFDFLSIQPGSRLELETWLLFLVWISARVLLVRLPIWRCDQSHPDCVRCHPVGSPWLLRSCTHRNNAIASLMWSVLRREVSESAGITPLIWRVIHW